MPVFLKVHASTHNFFVKSTYTKIWNDTEKINKYIDCHICVYHAMYAHTIQNNGLPFILMVFSCTVRCLSVTLRNVMCDVAPSEMGYMK